MKKPGKPPARHKRHLSEDDEAVWSHTAQSLEPLKKAKSRVHTATEALEQALQLDRPGKSERATGTSTAPVRDHNVKMAKPAETPPRAAAKAPPLSEFDKRKARKLGAGQIDIDARIDLHGMRQAQAHTALKRFLYSSYQNGYRWVLIITGKGASQNRDRDDESWSLASVEPGVLRRNVPGWLSEPDLRTIVISFKTAAVRHGGEGALYVHLRNPERAGR